MPMSLILWHLNLEWKPHRDWLVANNVDLTPFTEEEEYQYFNLQIQDYTKSKWSTKQHVFRLRVKMAKKFNKSMKPMLPTVAEEDEKSSSSSSEGDNSISLTSSDEEEILQTVVE
jgi:hypothetical protein